MKWDYDYSIGQLKPDVVLQLWAKKPDDIPCLNRDYVPLSISGFTWYVRRDSQHVMWSKIPGRDLSKAVASR